ncbi:hypothetical protein GCM10025734_51120 [Kitasatospora paranensis]
MTDPEHEGHPGDTIDQIRAGVDGWLASSRPDVVLLHIGINDLNQNLDQAHAADRATQLIDRIFTDRPNVTVVMQGLIPTTPGWWNQDLSQPVAQYNGRLRQLEATEQQAGRHFRFVDAPALTPANRADATHPAQMTDGLHPNDAGYSCSRRTSTRHSTRRTRPGGSPAAPRAPPRPGPARCTWPT